jgi:hypothetical protein
LLVILSWQIAHGESEASCDSRAELIWSWLGATTTGSLNRRGRAAVKTALATFVYK